MKGIVATIIGYVIGYIIGHLMGFNEYTMLLAAGVGLIFQILVFVFEKDGYREKS